MHTQTLPGPGSLSVSQALNKRTEIKMSRNPTMQNKNQEDFKLHLKCLQKKYIL